MPIPTTTRSRRCRISFRRGDDPWAGIDAVKQSLQPLLDMVAADEGEGLGDMPYPPSYPKMPGEPTRVQPSRARDRPME